MSKTKSKRNTNAISTPVKTFRDGEANELLQELIDRALAGNITALRLCIERLIPVTRERAVPVQIPVAATALQVTIALQALFNALSDGQLTPNEAQKLAAILENQRKAIETLALEQRVDALEQHALDEHTFDRTSEPEPACG